MSLSFDYPSERERQHAQWKAARARLGAAAIAKKAEAEISVSKSVEKLVTHPVPVAPTMPFERDWLDVATKYAIADIVKEVCEQFGVSKTEIQSVRRHPQITNPRQIAMALCKQLTSRSFPEIGRRIGMRDHTTVIHACRKYQPVMDEVVRIVPEASPISVWVAAFKAQLDLTDPAKRKPYVRRVSV